MLCFIFSTIKIFRLPRSLESVVGFFMERWSVSSWNGAWFLHGTVLGFFMDRCPCTYARCDSSWNGAWFPHGTVLGLFMDRCPCTQISRVGARFPHGTVLRFLMEQCPVSSWNGARFVHGPLFVYLQKIHEPLFPI